MVSKTETEIEKEKRINDLVSDLLFPNTTAAWIYLRKMDENELRIQILLQLMEINYKSDKFHQEWKEVVKENDERQQKQHDEMKRHWKEMHDNPNQKEKEKMIEEYMGMVKKMVQPQLDEQEEWGKKIGKSKG